MKESNIIEDVYIPIFSNYSIYNEQFDSNDLFIDNFDYRRNSLFNITGIWKRPHEIVNKIPEVVYSFLSPSVKQLQIGDCVNIASIMAISNHMSLFESSFLKDIIYPHNKDGFPLYNPYGKYIIKLFINGEFRSVVVDDRILIHQNYNINLLGQSLIPNELWVTLIEKALLKVYYTDHTSYHGLTGLTGWSTRFYYAEELKEDLKSIWSEIYEDFKYSYKLIHLLLLL